MKKWILTSAILCLAAAVGFLLVFHFWVGLTWGMSAVNALCAVGVGVAYVALCLLFVQFLEFLDDRSGRR